MFLISSALLQGHVTLASFPSTQSVTASTVIRRGKPQKHGMLANEGARRDPCVRVVASLSNMNPYELLNPVPICSSLCHGHGSRWASLQDPLSQLSTTTIVCLETAGQQRLQSSHVKFAVEERLKTVQNGRRTATATASLASTCSVVNVIY